jgi:hypothetical protein
MVSSLVQAQILKKAGQPWGSKKKPRNDDDDFRGDGGPWHKRDGSGNGNGNGYSLNNGSKSW